LRDGPSPRFPSGCIGSASSYSNAARPNELRQTSKVDIFSRNQVGRGANNPNGGHYTGSYVDLDGIVSCSVVSDPDQLTKDFNDTGFVKRSLIPSGDFWASEYTAGKLPPQNIDNLIIYELHVPSTWHRRHHGCRLQPLLRRRQ
jgi:hypothetical protein